MSIGNLKDTGNQGNNLPYQWKVLQGLQTVIDNLSGSTPGQARVPHIVRVTNSWSNPTAIFSFSIGNVGASNGTVLGQTIKPGEVVNYDASGENNFFASGIVTVNGSGTELLITYISA
jgi:hypothetical protein